MNLDDTQTHKDGRRMDIIARGTIHHPIDRVWDVLQDFHGLMAWHPGLATIESEGSGVGSLRRVTLTDGRAATETLDVLDRDRHVLVYGVTESARPATVGMSAAITLTEIGDSSTAVEWVVTPPDRPDFTDEIADGMRAYYPSRIQNLADEVGRRAERG
jgi:uncharacterized protein YndB with AHSA1/START domain